MPPPEEEDKRPDTPALRTASAYELLQQLKELRKQQDENFRRLERSLAIIGLWPDAFLDHGRCKVDVIFGATNIYVEIRRDDGKHRTFPLDEVPEELWPDPSSPEYATFPDRQRRLRAAFAAIRKQRSAEKDKVPGA